MLRAIEHRWSGVTDSYAVKEEILDRRARELATRFRHNIECYIGTLRIPLGLAGPLSVNGDYARGEYLVPLATTEATLVASYDRGSRLISECNGCTSMITEEALGRSPGFVFADLRQVRCFQQWIDAQGETLRRVAAATSRYGRLKALKLTVEGNHVYLNFEFMTGDAAGQNMATIATEALVRFILDNSPVTPIRHFIEANHCGDKKASFRSLIGVRGKRVSAEVVVPDSLIRRRLHTSAAAMEDYWRMAALGGVLSGTLGVQGHYANGLAALFLACGQDVACVAEAATGVTRIETCGSGDLYAAVTIPALVVGTVGGGTGLPAQQACLRLMKLNGPGNASAFAEVCAAVALAGELSIMGAICSQEFARSHRRRARGGKVPNLGA
ncbi:MAG: hydroxymethylglutaryl-CoA reductase [Gammaproteobacteria bacterium]|nr:hydroxymethylglutaryl-CoA reductase [Gammaproteobacteria bacterium]